MQLPGIARPKRRPRVICTHASLALAITVALVTAAAPTLSNAKQFGAGGETPTAPGQNLDRVFRAYELLELDLESVVRTLKSSNRLTLDLGGTAYELELEATDLRAQDLRATVTTDDGVLEQELPRVGTYKGTVAGETGSDVRLLVRDDMFFGYIRTADDWLFIDPAAQYEPGAGPGRVVAYREADVRPEFAGAYGAGGLETHAAGLVGDEEARTAATPGAPRMVEIATEADFEFFQAYPELPNFVILGILNQVNGIYESEVGLTFSVSAMNIWATAQGPYATNNAADQLSEFTQYWNANMDHVRRDVAHLFTGKRLVGGTTAAWPDAVCTNPARSYGVTQNMASANMVRCAAQALGRNFGAPYDPASMCGGSGPLMCTQLQSGPNYFSQASKAAIARHVGADGSCLSDVAEFRMVDNSCDVPLVRGYTNFRKSWDIIIPIHFPGRRQADLLFYDRNAGHGEFYATDGNGGMTQVQLHTNWRTTWDIIISGDFGGPLRTDLLFYDRETGLGEFYAVDTSGGITLLAQHTNWRTTWDLIVPGNYGGHLPGTDLFFYDRETGHGEFYDSDGQGGIAQLPLRTPWGAGWDLIISRFGGRRKPDILLFYDREGGVGAFFGRERNTNYAELHRFTNWRTTWDMIIPGRFGGANYLFYDRSARQGEFWAISSSGGMAQVRGHNGWRNSWYLIVPAEFIPPVDPARYSNTDLLFYER
jgi:hypothetical protein